MFPASPLERNSNRRPPGRGAISARLSRIDSGGFCLPKRFSTRQRTVIYAELVKRDGEKCALCGMVPIAGSTRTAERLEIDHWPIPFAAENGANGADRGRSRRASRPVDQPVGLRLLCARCNRQAQFNGKLLKSVLGVTVSPSLSVSHDPKGSPPVTPGLKESDTEPDSPARELRQRVDYVAGSSQMQVSDAAMPGFFTFVLAEVDRAAPQPCDVRELKGSGAWITGCSFATAGDYMEILTSPKGPLERFKKGNVWLVWRRKESKP